MPRQNLLSLFQEFHNYANDIAVIQHRGYRREVWSYHELAGTAVECALELKRRGIRTGDRVLLWGPNSAQWMVAFWACIIRGAVVVPIDQGATPDFAARVARDAAVKLVIAARATISGSEKLRCIGMDPAVDATSFLTLDDLARVAQHTQFQRSSRAAGAPHAKYYEELSDEPLTRKHVAEILFTSGTTAEPRGVVLTHGNFLANLEPLEQGIGAYRKYERWFHPLRFVTLVPLSHVFGQFMGLFVPPLLGAAVVFETSAKPSEIISGVKRERATALIAVPRMLDVLRAGLLRDLETGGQSKWFAQKLAAATERKFLHRAWIFRRIHRRFGWKFWAFISGGAALSGETEEFFKRLGYAVVQGYGMTETASLISVNHPFRATPGSIGKVLPGREFRLGDDSEILVRGENVSANYWEQGELRQATLENGGWLRTGDIGELDAEGNLKFRGRKKNVIVTSAGLNIYPEDLETALRRQAAVRDCVVVAIERKGNAEPCAVLLLNSGDESSARQAVGSANATLAEYQQMRDWLVWPEFDFPRSPTGKPRIALISARVTELQNESRGRGKAQIAQSRLGAAGEGSQGIGEVVLEKFGSASGNSDQLEHELNLTSLDRVELLSALEDKFHVELNEVAFAGARTVGDVERLLRQPAAQRASYTYPRWTQRAPVLWIRLAVYYALVWPATQILGHPKIAGRENLRGVHGPVLIVSNHITRRVDIGLILAALPGGYRHRLATAMGGETLQNMRRPPADWFFAKRCTYQIGYWLVTALFNVFPLPQRSNFRASFRFAGESVDRGYSILVFPEGEVSNDGTMAAFQSGIGLLAENLAIPIIPMRLDGVSQMKREHRRLARPGELTVRIGAPVTFSPGTPPEKITTELEYLVRKL
ncbi:MAG TPA: AMP-binding protein [Candidatus Dormibacteraeota bacterium]|nr:AMP-binding protein [Candidatus Dormibacteraeota bacterium]